MLQKVAKLASDSLLGGETLQPLKNTSFLDVLTENVRSLERLSFREHSQDIALHLIPYRWLFFH